MKLLKYFTSIPVISTAILAMGTYIGVVYALNTWDTGYQAPLWTNTDVIIGSAGGTCQRVYNGGGVASVFVPTKTVGEWNTFNSNKPSGVTVSACCSPMMGTACDCEEIAYSCRYGGYDVDDAGWCVSTGGWKNWDSDNMGPAPVGSCAGYYVATVSCTFPSAGTVQCDGSCQDNTTYGTCGSINYVNAIWP